MSFRSASKRKSVWIPPDTIFRWMIERISCTRGEMATRAHDPAALSADILHTGGDGYWGSYEELSRNTRDGRMVEAAILTVIWPEYESMESMRQHAFFFFRDMQLLSEEMEEADNEPQIYGEEGIGI